jgi:hypothetical protein
MNDYEKYRGKCKKKTPISKGAMPFAHTSAMDVLLECFK